MALDKLVDSTQLDNNLTSVANAIRAKSGGSGQLAFPAGFVSEIGNIPTGGGVTPTGTKEITITENGTTTEDVTNYANAQITVNVSSSGGDDMFFKAITNASVNSVVLNCDEKPIRKNACANWSNLVNARFVNIGKSPYVASIGDSAFTNCWGLKTATFVFANDASTGTSVFAGTTDLETVYLDVPGSLTIDAGFFANANVLDKIILATSSVPTLSNVNAFNNSHYKSGGSGGTIYIPKTLYDHLGDGSSLDYKAATNWSTVDGYGTITWAAIEGSIYETQYADGTPIT